MYIMIYSMKKTTILSLLLICSVCVKAQSTNLTDRIDSLIATVVTKGTPGATAGVVKDGKILYKKTYGMANLEYGIPVTDSTLFNLASVSKQFTAFLTLLLVNEGKIGLDDPVDKYIPEIKNYEHPVTIRQMLHHTSGIPSTDNLTLFAGLSLDMPWDDEDEMNMVRSYQKLNYKPNDEHLYSNTGYFLLARIIEKAEGKPFSQCMTEKVFRPLNMKTALIYDSPGKIIPNRAAGYQNRGENYAETNAKGGSITGPTNVYVSVIDMISWCVNMTTKSYGGEQLYDRLFNPADTLNNGDTIQYTYGLSADSHKGLKVIEHGGYTFGIKAQITLIPNAHFAVFVLSNNENVNTTDMTWQITDWYLKDLLKPEILKEHKEITVNPELYDLYKGSYVFPDGVVIAFDNVNDTLRLNMSGVPHFIIYPEKENEFFFKDFNAQCTFVKDSSGKVNEIIWHQSNTDTKAVRYTPPKLLTQEELMSYTGKYEIPEFNAIYPVTLKENELRMTLPKEFKKVNIETDMILGHMSGDKFYGRLGMAEFKRNEKGDITGFVLLDIGRLRNIEFIKRD
jgi:CubicO group peptidase (beta-lactamase class C family)